MLKPGQKLNLTKRRHTCTHANERELWDLRLEINIIIYELSNYFPAMVITYFLTFCEEWVIGALDARHSLFCGLL